MSHDHTIVSSFSLVSVDTSGLLWGNRKFWISKKSPCPFKKSNAKSSNNLGQKEEWKNVRVNRQWLTWFYSALHCVEKGKREKTVPPVRLELTTFRLWDWRTANCAKEAADLPLKKTIVNSHNPNNAYWKRLYPQRSHTRKYLALMAKQSKPIEAFTICAHVLR